MTFTSIWFIAFFGICYLIYWAFPQKKRPLVLFLFSLIFYATFQFFLLPHFLVVLLLNYYFAQDLKQNKVKSRFILYIAINIAHLLFYKYVNSLLVTAGFPELKSALGIIQPIGISFYTFQYIAFLTESYRGNIPNLQFTRFALFMSYFPHLISGPILRYNDFYVQISNENHKPDFYKTGIYLFILGAVKKFLIADFIGYRINPVWKTPENYDNVSILIAIFLYSAQLYCDFSGYIDMARGQSRLFGYNLPENFQYPFLSRSFSEVWRRWHITLSLFIRDYIYFPLGGSRKGKLRADVNLMIAMTLSGIWHGDTVNFLIWGFLHGLFLIFEKYSGLGAVSSHWFKVTIQHIWVLGGWAFAFIFFRAVNFTSAIKMFSGIIHSGKEVLPDKYFLLLFLLATALLNFSQKYLYLYKDFLIRHYKILIPVFALGAYFLSARMNIPTEPFIYVQF